jgi:hypothetical protein
MTKTIDPRTHSVIFNVWDTAGQERFHSLVPLVLVFDATSDSPLPGLDVADRTIADQNSAHPGDPLRQQN